MSPSPPPAAPHSPPSPPRTLRDWLLVFTASLLLYTSTANRGAQWQDSGDFILRIVKHEILNDLGLALSHPLHHLLGRTAVAPGLLEPAFAITLISAFGAALAVANVFGCVTRLTGRRGVALFAAASLAVANTFWHLATVTEVYTLSAALFAGECWALSAYALRADRRQLWLMLALNGLGMANHLQAGLTTPVLTIVVAHSLYKKQLTLRDAAIGALFWLAGTLPYTIMVAAEWARSGDFVATMRSALFGTAYGGNVLNAGLSSRLLIVSLAFTLYSFPSLLLPASLYGIIRARRVAVPSLAHRALLAGLLIHAVFVLRYNVVDQHTFFLPVYVLLCIFGGMGAAAGLAAVSEGRNRLLVAAALVLLVATPLHYAYMPAVARHSRLLGDAARNKPYRDDYIYLLTPWSVVDRSAERMSTEAVRLAGPAGMILVEERMGAFALEYQRIRHGFDDLTIDGVPLPELTGHRARLADRVRRAVAAGRPIVLVPERAEEPSLAPPLGHWRREGDLYVLDPAPAAVSTASAPR